jgi:hypothetical protein
LKKYGYELFLSGAPSHKKLPECSLNVPWIFPECSLNVPWMFPEPVRVNCSSRAPSSNNWLIKFERNIYGLLYTSHQSSRGRTLYSPSLVRS